MPRRTFSLKMLRALSLTFLMVWLWQTSALLTGIDAPTAEAASGLGTSTSCVLCTADNQSSSTADHAHEPPSLVAPYALPIRSRAPVPNDSAVSAGPIGFIEPIERPPRSLLLI
ncbi:hypothetical protein ACIGCM_00235 [Pseudomonas sp. NPDC078700]|uniref:hypothetical protein n=1 Tax=Pseudomonas sp. NPDC078700 TaxID=3364424 RepID=UPI0037CC6DEF